MDRAKSVFFALLLAAGGVMLVYKLYDSFVEGPKKLEESTRTLARAIEANDPSAAPAGAESYVRGVRKVFGPVREARFLDVYTERSGEGRNAQTEMLAEILVRAKRGAAVLEIEFVDDKDFDDMEELEPSEIHTDLSRKDMAAVKRGFARRGGDAAGSIDLDVP